MDIRFNCEHCGKHLVVDEAGAGRSVKCPECSNPVDIPAKVVESDTDTRDSATIDTPKLRIRRQEGIQDTISCPNCAEEISARSIKCYHCGSMLSDAVTAAYHPITEPLNHAFLTKSGSNSRTIRNPANLVEIAKWQRLLILFYVPISTIISLAAIILLGGEHAEANSSGGLSLTGIIFTIIIVYQEIRLAIALGQITPWICVPISIVPGAGVFGTIALSFAASKALRVDGIRIGWFGAYKDDVLEVEKTGLKGTGPNGETLGSWLLWFLVIPIVIMLAFVMIIAVFGK